jgi:hypothetical protein
MKILSTIIHPPQNSESNKMISKAMEEKNETTKHVKFTYVLKETNVITKLFKQTKLKIAFTTNNSIKSTQIYTHMLTDKLFPNAKKNVKLEGTFRPGLTIV